MSQERSFAEHIAAILWKNKVIDLDMAEGLANNFKASAKSVFLEFLIDENMVAREDVLQALSEFYKVPYVDVVGEFFDHFQVHRFPKDFLLRYAIIPMQVDQDMLAIIAADPTLEGLESAIRDYVSYDIVFRVGLERDICDAIKEYYDEATTVVHEDDPDYEEDPENPMDE